jgi:hypothetical protein
VGIKAGVEQRHSHAAPEIPGIGMQSEWSRQSAESGFGIERPSHLHLLVQRSITMIEQGL